MLNDVVNFLGWAEVCKSNPAHLEHWLHCHHLILAIYLCPTGQVGLALPLSQITHQSHFMSLAQIVHQSDGRIGRNMIVDWLVGGRGGAAEPFPNNSSVLWDEWVSTRDRENSFVKFLPLVFAFSSSLPLCASCTSALPPYSRSAVHTCSVSKTVPLAPSPVSLHMTVDSFAHSDTEQSSAWASVIKHTHIQNNGVEARGG